MTFLMISLMTSLMISLMTFLVTFLVIFLVMPREISLMTSSDSSISPFIKTVVP